MEGEDQDSLGVSQSLLSTEELSMKLRLASSTMFDIAPNVTAIARIGGNQKEDSADHHTPSIGERHADMVERDSQQTD